MKCPTLMCIFTEFRQIYTPECKKNQNKPYSSIGNHCFGLCPPTVDILPVLEFHTNGIIIVYTLFVEGFFHLACHLVSYMLLHILVIFSILLHNISLYEYNTAYPFS